LIYRDKQRKNSNLAVAPATACEENLYVICFEAYLRRKWRQMRFKEVKTMSDPKIVFKSEVPEEALVSLAMFMMEEMERFMERDIGKEEFEKWIREASEEDKD